MTLISLANGLPSFCEVYGHNWQPTSKPGKYQCSSCKQEAYCSACLLTVLQGAQTMRCERHQEVMGHE